MPRLPKRKAYIVLVDSRFVRDTQLFYGDGISDEAMNGNEFDPSAYDYGYNWRDADVSPYIACVLAEGPEQAIAIASQDCDVDPRTLVALETNIAGTYA